MSNAMQELYQQVILDHYKAPHGKGLQDAAAGSACGESHQVNPTCGDEVTLRVEVDGQQITGLSWDGQGCSISQASLSVMTELTQGASVADAERLGEVFRDLMNTRGKGLDDDDAEDLLGDAVAFTGVSQFPARIKCALLGWSALRDALVRGTSVTASAPHTTQEIS
ncbi:iron-sulfur cluster assembly scaffold protein NifU [Flavimobilis marinus]|uniref:Nitrogen fixation protein NifU n=1 Tax=Flavimobilis marinus TaxID=285351 RepID=A0A1I2F1A6_9MICO|nr:SUF system NifU family Fe-S cluster assembly protein [Flavimobilis marinus]GHG53577.1 iron-sulfur cluster assembly scaffold protein NifU [Flavimobilis marinus]SFE98311.1 nitrogen fixation protein NifU [Flavimobilis marinus]